MHQVQFKQWHCDLLFARYIEDKSVAIRLFLSTTGEPVATATVCLAPEWPAREGHVWIKDYSENQGMLDALTEAGIIEPTGVAVQNGFVTIPEAKLLVEVDI